MNHRSLMLAAAVVAAGILSLGNPLMAKSMDHGVDEHHHDTSHFREVHQHRHHDGYNDGYSNNCWYPRSYIDGEAYRHSCPATGDMGYGMDY